MNNLTIKPKFFRDALWVYPLLMLILGVGFSIFMWRLSKGEDYWMGLSFLMNLIIQPIFLLLWIDNVSNRAVFKEDRLILKGFLHKKEILYKDIKGIIFSDIQQPFLVYYDLKFGGNNSIQLPIWNYSINLFIDEVKKRSGIEVNGYPDKVNRINFRGKIWFVIIMALTIGVINIFFWNPPELKPEFQDTTLAE